VKRAEASHEGVDDALKRSVLMAEAGRDAAGLANRKFQEIQITAKKIKPT
jgi:hypothetical protein